MSEIKNAVDVILGYGINKIEELTENRYLKLGLKFNPFPRSGTADMNSNDTYTESLVPVNDESLVKIGEYIRRALVPNSLNPNNKLATGVIIGNYGMGKTQLMLYIKTILNQLYKSENSLINIQKPYVIYIDNPGVSISELIGAIIQNIGQENFKKFLWKNIIKRIEKEDQYIVKLKRFNRAGSLTMFDSERNIDPFHESNKVSYKLFIESFINKLSQLRERKSFEAEIKQIIIEVLQFEFKDGVLAEYFFDIVSNDLGINSSWEAFVSGTGRHLEGKESEIIKIIFKIVREQGFTHFFVLVDEFEDISQGRLTKGKLDNYLYNLRILLDDNREWCLLFAMVPDALRQIRKISPPLVQRITAITIELNKLTSVAAERIVSNYLALARISATENLIPFSSKSIVYLNGREEIDGTPRSLLQVCFGLIEQAADTNIELIDEEFIKKNLVF